MDEPTGYRAFGIGPEHIPELIRLLQDQELRDLDGVPEDEDVPSWYAHIHAWRALGELRAEAAIEPLLRLIDGQKSDEDWSDWVTEEVPDILGKIGPPALSGVSARLEQSRREKYLGWSLTRALASIAENNPETRTDVLNRLVAVLQLAAENEPSVNGGIICELVELEATNTWDDIEKAFATGNVDESIVGDAPTVKWELGLGPMPPPPFLPKHSTSSSPTSKARAKKRAQKKKAQKRNKKRRK